VFDELNSRLAAPPPTSGAPGAIPEPVPVRARP
jgi:hypothetical protein